MPELPEVSTIVSDLQILPHRHCYFDVVDPKAIGGLLKNCTTEEFIESLTGHYIKSVDRVGKWIDIRLSTGRHFVIHLGMYGGLIINVNGYKFDHIRCEFRIIGDSINHQMIYNDMRSWGKFYIFKDDKEVREFFQDRVGPDALLVDHTTMKEILHRYNGHVVDLLLEQDRIAGIGNIYRSEILFEAQICPKRPTSDIDDAEIMKLTSSMHAVLRRGIINRGTSIQDYVDGYGDDGGNQEHLWVYGRQGKPCMRNGCHGIIERTSEFDRNVYWCPRCQV